jgi:hypothetical protein
MNMRQLLRLLRRDGAEQYIKDNATTIYVQCYYAT